MRSSALTGLALLVAVGCAVAFASGTADKTKDGLRWRASGSATAHKSGYRPVRNTAAAVVHGSTHRGRRGSQLSSYWVAERKLVAALKQAGRLGTQVRRLRREARAREHARTLQVVRGSGPGTLTYAIRLASTVYGVSPTEMRSVAQCESNLYRWARNGIYRSYWQQGPMFEATPFGQAGFSVWDPIPAALSVAMTVSQEGWSQWECKP